MPEQYVELAMIVVNPRVNIFRSQSQTVRRLDAYTLTRMPHSLTPFPGTLDTRRRNLHAEGRWAMGHLA
jgi:hypothetical protein